MQHGGHLLSSFRSFVADRDVTVWHDRQPHGLADVFGIRVGEFTRPDDDSELRVVADGPLAAVGADAADMDLRVRGIMELVEPADGTQTIAGYAQPAWHEYAAVTRKKSDNGGWAEWIGTMTSADVVRALVKDAVAEAGLAEANASALKLAGTVTVRRGTNRLGKTVTYLLNYAPREVSFDSPYAGTDLLTGTPVSAADHITIEPWGVLIVES